ncbi:MAG: cytochrome C oxidase subunit IV family protein [Alphaproteobacteria bacterium]|uniref:Cytochrome C oxidase subunit IV family protein n=1 Tax=Candidatus Nitrobium versatile TaxID=2884831 RepID=A0A953J8A8_9BACT|nr:cytochrome C oxidase subunit IV family protein [Candidatus Nitrobium versatile]
MEEEKTPAPEEGPRTYLAVWGALLLLTAVTVAASGTGLRYGILLSLGIASCKAGLVLVFFMHMRHEGGFLKGAVAVSVLTLTALIMLTFIDVWYR